MSLQHSMYFDFFFFLNYFAYVLVEVLYGIETDDLIRAKITKIFPKPAPVSS